MTNLYHNPKLPESKYRSEPGYRIPVEAGIAHRRRRRKIMGWIWFCLSVLVIVWVVVLGFLHEFR